MNILPAETGLHLLGIGGVGGMTLSVMMRASLGRSGRALEVGPMLTAAFACAVLAAVVRASAPAQARLWVAALLWVVGFATFLARNAPILTMGNVGPKRADLKSG